MCPETRRDGLLATGSLWRVEVVRFTDEYELAAGIYDMATAELRARDERQGQPLQRWMAVDEGEVAAAVSTWGRPDDRRELIIALRHEGLFDTPHAARHDARALGVSRATIYADLKETQ